MQLMKKLFLLIKRRMMMLLYQKWLKRVGEVAGLQRVGVASLLIELVFRRLVRMGLILVAVTVIWLLVRRAVLMLVTMGIVVVLILMNLILLVPRLMALVLLMPMIIAADLLLLRTLVLVLPVLMVMALVLSVVRMGVVVLRMIMTMATVLLGFMVTVARRTASRRLPIRRVRLLVAVIAINQTRGRNNGVGNERSYDRSWTGVFPLATPHPRSRSRRRGLGSYRSLTTPIRRW
jgi:hypothetical protein